MPPLIYWHQKNDFFISKTIIFMKYHRNLRIKTVLMRKSKISFEKDFFEYKTRFIWDRRLKNSHFKTKMINSWFRNCDFNVENDSFIPKQKKNCVEIWLKNGNLLLKMVVFLIIVLHFLHEWPFCSENDSKWSFVLSCSCLLERIWFLF